LHSALTFIQFELDEVQQIPVICLAFASPQMTMVLRHASCGEIIRPIKWHSVRRA
jgi:hypothetical protein